jgi:hypothetical protein
VISIAAKEAPNPLASSGQSDMSGYKDANFWIPPAPNQFLQKALA